MSATAAIESCEIRRTRLFERLADGHCLITANNRLGKITRDQYTDWRSDRGDLRWPTARIYSWKQWLDQLWEEAGLNGLDGTQRAIPGEQQLNQLWQLVLTRGKRSNPLLHVEAVAMQLRDTRSLVREWLLDLASEGWQHSENENHQAFLAWNSDFESLCKEQGWLPPEDRIAILTRLATQSALRVTGPLDLLGFDEFSPAQAALLDALGRDLSIAQLSLSARNHKAAQWRSADPRSELDMMARWARHRLESEPDSQIAIVVPGLSQRRDDIERALKTIFGAGDNNTTAPKPWNISLGEPLSRQAMIEAAFKLFGLLEFRFDIQQASSVLRSPWVRGAFEEQGSRALLEKCLRSKYSRQINLFELRYRAREMIRFDREGHEIPEPEQQGQAWMSPVFAGIVQTLTNFAELNKAAQPPSAWAERFDALLGSVGWPLSSGERTEDERSNDWQVLQAWNAALSELASLDTVRATMRRGDAVRHLRQICEQTIFQARSPYCGLQVLGVYEASGLGFDHTWVLGLHHGNWPQTAQPNPFIPAAMQIAHGLPHCSPQREHEVARQVTQRLMDCSGSIIFSAPERFEDEVVLPSPLLRKLPELPNDDLLYWRLESWAQLIAQAPGPISEALGMPGRATGHDPRGGSRILKNQALCPFRAFAENRLLAEPLDAPAQGISAAQHGSLLHGALEGFWKDVVSHRVLMGLHIADLESRVARHVKAAIDDDRSLSYRTAFKQVESARLQRHMLAYLELEKQREPFEAVAFEKVFLLEIEGQVVRLIIDRIDQLENGGLAIIDYKSGKVSPAKWFGERPEDPQLPLYAISAGQTPDAVVLAVIREDGCQFRGVARRNGIFPGLPPKATKATQQLHDAGDQLPTTIEQWRVTLHRLMREFLAGEAAIDPKNGRKTCINSYCALRSLCRIDELDPLSALQEEYSP